MPRRIATSSLNCTTMDIMNTIRQNADPIYQNLVPPVNVFQDIPKVGEIILGNSSLSNQFINALMNRIAKVMIRSLNFNNPYSALKKGELLYGETIENVFVEIAKPYLYNNENNADIEYGNYAPDLKSTFHAINWRVMYPITISEQQLRTAFLSEDGLFELVNTVVSATTKANQYDEYLLFKYLLIKSVSKGVIKRVQAGDLLVDDAGKFRGVSNRLTIASREFNEANVLTSTDRSKQVIFMDANYNGSFDAEVLAHAFNMNKADFFGSLYLVDDWTSFDNERFKRIRERSDMLEEVTQTELNAMKLVKAVLLDADWFLIYDNLNEMRTNEVAHTLSYNYFYHCWKTISYNPFANAVVFVGDSTTTIPVVTSVDIKVSGITQTAAATIYTLTTDIQPADVSGISYEFLQNQSNTQGGIAVHPYGVIIVPATVAAGTTVNVDVKINSDTWQATGIDYSTLTLNQTIATVKL